MREKNVYRCLYGNSGGFADMCEAVFTLLTNPPGSVLGEHYVRQSTGNMILLSLKIFSLP